MKDTSSVNVSSIAKRVNPLILDPFAKISEATPDAKILLFCIFPKAKLKSGFVFIRVSKDILESVREIDDALIPLRKNIDAIKILNTDMLSKKLTLEGPFEKQFIDLIHKLDEKYDYVFVDVTPSISRTSELLSELCNQIILIVELNKFDASGFYSTLQYFVDCGIDFKNIHYVLPNSFSKMKSVPAVALDEIAKIID